MSETSCFVSPGGEQANRLTALIRLSPTLHPSFIISYDMENADTSLHSIPLIFVEFLPPPELDRFKDALTQSFHIGCDVPWREKMQLCTRSPVLDGKINTTEEFKDVEFSLPPVLFYDPASVRLTGINRAGKRVWSCVIPYHLPSVFTEPPLPEYWTRSPNNPMVVECKIPVAEMIREEYVEEEKKYYFNIDYARDGHVAVNLGINKITRKDGKPLTFYTTRVWAVRFITVVLSKLWTKRLLT
jgi:hypothetical protein